MTLGASMRLTIFSGPQQRQQTRGSASYTFLISRKRLAALHYHGNIPAWPSHILKSPPRGRYRYRSKCAGNSGSVRVPFWNGMSTGTGFWFVEPAVILPRMCTGRCFRKNLRRPEASQR